MTIEDVAGWDADLAALTGGLGWLFARPGPRKTFADMVRGLLADVPRKNSWQLAEHAGHRTAYGFEWFLNGARWDADVLRDQVRSYVVEGLGGNAGARATLVIDDTQVIKKGDKSVGVAPQHCGLTGQTENCQAIVLLTYATTAGHAYVDRELYLPERWTSDPARLAQAGVPGQRGFSTKPHLAVAMLERAVAAKVPFRWVAADADYGKDPTLRRFCHDRRLSYVLAVPCSLPLTTAPAPQRQVDRADDLIGRVRVDAWAERSAGDGSKGARRYDWAAVAVTVKGEQPADGFAHTLLIRRSISGRNEYAFFLVHAPIATPIGDMIAAAGFRWKIEENNAQGKDLLGLDQYQVRKWTPFHRHITIVMLAQAFLAVTRAKLGKVQVPRLRSGPPSATPSPRSATSSPGSS